MMPRCFYKNCKRVGQVTGLGRCDRDASEAAGRPIFDSVYLCEKHAKEILKLLGE